MAKDTEQIILEVARKQFVQNGFAGTRMQEIADEAGINKAMLHYYFRSKQKLYERISEEILGYVIPKFAEAMALQGTVWEKIERLVDVHIGTLLDQPDIPIFIMSELSQKREHFVAQLKKRSEFFPHAQQFIIQLMGEMQAGRIKTMPPHHLLLNIVSMTVFPFMSKPVFLTIFDLPEKDFVTMMEERKVMVMEFVRGALRVD